MLPFVAFNSCAILEEKQGAWVRGYCSAPLGQMFFFCLFVFVLFFLALCEDIHVEIALHELDLGSNQYWIFNPLWAYGPSHQTKMGHGSLEVEFGLLLLQGILGYTLPIPSITVQKTWLNS